MADPTVQTEVKVVEATVSAKVTAFVKAHTTEAIGVVAGYAASHFHILGAVLKLI